MAEAVSLRILDGGGYTVSGVTLRVFSGTTPVTWGVTDSGGLLEILLPAGDYTVRGWKSGMSFGVPASFTVVDGASAALDISVDVADPPIPVDSRVCIVRGYVYNGFLAPRRNADITLWLEQPPVVAGDDLVLGGPVAVRTDANGYVEIPLMRTACYRFTVSGIHDQSFPITVPDTATANVAKVLFPEIGSVSWEETPLTLSVGESRLFVPQVYTTGGVLLSGSAREYLVWSSSDPTVAGVAPVEDGLLIEGFAAGTTTITAVRNTPSSGRALVPYIPEISITGLPQPIEVT